MVDIILTVIIWIPNCSYTSCYILTKIAAVAYSYMCVNVLLHTRYVHDVPGVPPAMTATVASSLHLL